MVFLAECYDNDGYMLQWNRWEKKKKKVKRCPSTSTILHFLDIIQKEKRWSKIEWSRFIRIKNK